MEFLLLLKGNFFYWVHCNFNNSGHSTILFISWIWYPPKSKPLNE